jgi:hypothetical protein
VSEPGAIATGSRSSRAIPFFVQLTDCDWFFVIRSLPLPVLTPSHFSIFNFQSSLLDVKLVVLGSGTSVPHPRRASSAFWLETSSGSMLLDCSADAPHRMAQENLDWMNLDAIWISHLHLDHCAGLASLLFGFKWAPGIDRRQKPLKIFGCEGVTKFLQAIDESSNYNPRTAVSARAS